MEISNFRITAYLIIVFFWIGTFTSFAAGQTASLLKAKKEAEARGYVFITSHDDIVASAKAEGKLRVFNGQDPTTMKAMVQAFRKKYPFIDVRTEQIVGEDPQRMLLELQGGLTREWDVNLLAWDFYPEYLVHQKKFDILGMAEQGVLRIPTKMVDPVHRHVVALESNMQVLAYNKEIVSKEKLPNTLEDFLKPEFKGRKFAFDVRTKALPALVPLWGLEKVLDIARKLAAQNPIWYRSDSRALPMISIGEIPLVYGLNYKSVSRQQDKEARKVLEFKVVEPVPARLTEANAVLAKAANPHAGLLWLEFQASPEGQRILDEYDLAASLLSPGSVHEQLTRGKKVSIVDWDHFQKTAAYSNKIVEALGFPREDKK
jgi:ABC-type Fe3+ transport system substrate-binding protein